MSITLLRNCRQAKFGFKAVVIAGQKLAAVGLNNAANHGQPQTVGTLWHGIHTLQHCLGNAGAIVVDLDKHGAASFKLPYLNGAASRIVDHRVGDQIKQRPVDQGEAPQ